MNVLNDTQRLRIIVVPTSFTTKNYMNKEWSSDIETNENF